jgi:aminoglycoside phosphotransferase (APT) family kinase protein
VDAPALITEWIETTIGGSITALTQQPRWRPTWFVDVERAGATVPLCVRGERTDTALTFPLAHEMRFQEVLQRHAIAVPAIHGWIEDLPAVVMDRVPGRPDFAGVDSTDRDRIVERYFATLAQVHSLPIEPFVDAGIERAPAPEQSGWYGIGKMIDVFHAQKLGPDPFCEWAVGWIERHPPRSHGREGAVVWDSGQFHHDGEQFVSLIDLEIGHVGDPMMDLAGLRMRDSVIPFGEFEEIYAAYEDSGGVRVDIEAVELHHIAFTITNELSFGHTLRGLVPAADFATNLQWCNETNIYVTEAIADYIGIELPEVETPAPSATRTSVASAHLAHTLRNVHVDDTMVRYRLRGAFRVAQHLARYDEIGAAVTDLDLDELGDVLGHRPDSWLEGESELEEFVLADRSTGRYDDVLLPLFHRRNRRAQMLNGPAGSAMAHHNPIQRFPRRDRRSP